MYFGRFILSNISCRSSVSGRYFSLLIHKYTLDSIQIRYCSKLTKSKETETTLVIVNRSKSKTLTVVKPDSKLFEKPKLRRDIYIWKNSPTRKITQLMREMFPLKSIYRADLSQGMAELYEEVNEQMDLQCFLKSFNMPNSTASWMKVCELHVFLMCAKFRPEADLGKAATDYFMWEYFHDVEYRFRRLGLFTDAELRVEMRRLKLYTQYIFMGYDEGVQKNDMVLAAALWRRIFGFECDDFTLVERLVKYIRVQLMHLQMIKFRDLVFYRQQLFIPLSEVTLEKSTALVTKKLKQKEKRKLYSATLSWINEKTYIQ